MKCPHCLDNFHDNESFVVISEDSDGVWSISRQQCSACRRLVLYLTRSKGWERNNPIQIEDQELIRPRGSSRPPCPQSVPQEIAEDYLEACNVLADSAKASAALSRRCLQALLRANTGVAHGNLANEIQYAIDNANLPSHLAESVDAIRNIGNFAAHPMKSDNTGEILPVEPHEAEWTLDVLESLFDFYYVQPAILKGKRAALDAKLTSAGKPPMK